LLLDRDRRLVKTIQFAERTYIGDPFNVIRLFNEKEVDEICVLDIDATPDRREPDFDFISQLASECFVPLSYGGAVSSVEHARRLIMAGVEKVILRTHANLHLIRDISEQFGAQAVMSCIDYRRIGSERVAIDGRTLMDAAHSAAKAGVGELILQCVDLDGTRSGMDLDGISYIASSLPMPVIALGGAGEVEHMDLAVGCGADAAASGSAFSFIGPLRAVLVNYPSYSDRLKAREL
jgi:cyclase